MHTSKLALILVAGGTGERAERNIPKQFVEIHQKPVIVYSLESFLKYQTGMKVVVVVHTKYIDYSRALIQKYFPKAENIHIASGGETRFHSVKNGLIYLNTLNFDGLVAVHDAARPCVPVSLIKRCFETAQQYGNSIPAVPLSESIRQKREHHQSTMVDRTQFVIVQTPQCAHFSVLYKAFQMPYKDLFTDEANVLETFGEQIYLCEGDKNNIKLTYPIDFELASIILKQETYE